MPKKKKILKMKAMAKIGRKGGKATLDKYGKGHFSRAGKKGMAKRWGRKNKGTIYNTTPE